MKNNILNEKFYIPDNFHLRFQLISLLIHSYSKTTSFREFFNKKVELNRNTNKRKNDLEYQKKSLEHKIKKMQNGKLKKTKKISKNDLQKSIK